MEINNQLIWVSLINVFIFLKTNLENLASIFLIKVIVILQTRVIRHTDTISIQKRIKLFLKGQILCNICLFFSRKMNSCQLRLEEKFYNLISGFYKVTTLIKFTNICLKFVM